MVKHVITRNETAQVELVFRGSKKLLKQVEGVYSEYPEFHKAVWGRKWWTFWNWTLTVVLRHPVQGVLFDYV